MSRVAPSEHDHAVAVQSVVDDHDIEDRYTVLDARIERLIGDRSNTADETAGAPHSSS